MPQRRGCAGRSLLVSCSSLAFPWFLLARADSWLATHFQHQEFDTELNRRTLYLAVSNSPMDAVGLVDQTLPNPPVPPSGWAPIESVDLGILPIDQQNPELLARALWVLFCFCLSSR